MVAEPEHVLTFFLPAGQLGKIPFHLATIDGHEGPLHEAGKL